MKKAQAKVVECAKIKSLVPRKPTDMRTVRYSDVSFLRTVFIPNGFYSERSFIRTVFRPLIQKAYNSKGHCSENLIPKCHCSEQFLIRKVFIPNSFYPERFLIRTFLTPKGRFSEIRNKNLLEQTPFR